MVFVHNIFVRWGRNISWTQCMDSEILKVTSSTSHLKISWSPLIAHNLGCRTKVQGGNVRVNLGRFLLFSTLRLLASRKARPFASPGLHLPLCQIEWMSIKIKLIETVSLNLPGGKLEELSSCLSHGKPLKKQWAWWVALGAKAYTVMIYACLFEEPQVVRSFLCCHYAGIWGLKTLYVKWVDCQVPYKTTSDNHFAGEEIRKKVN